MIDKFTYLAWVQTTAQNHDIPLPANWETEALRKLENELPNFLISCAWDYLEPFRGG